jgi:hypothetical protein
MADNPETTNSSSQRVHRPVLVLLASHWLSMAGMFLLATAIITWVFVLPLHARGGQANPYIGIVVFVGVPILLLSGLVAVPLGLYLARRRIRDHVTVVPFDRGRAVRRLLIFFGVTTLINVIVGTQLTYRAVEQMESVQFCGQTCHVMTPQARTHMVSPHARVPCVGCHVAEGARGWIESKAAGSRQLLEVAMNTYPRPVPSALASGRLVPSRETCEHCHWPEKFSATRLKVFPKFAQDETNSETQTVLMMMVGGSRSGGIHGKHFGLGIEISFIAGDAERQTIPWVEYRNTQTGETRVYQAADAPASDGSGQKILMQCVDCHNRPTHIFEPADRALDKAFAGGWIPTSLPFLKKVGLEALQAEYSSSEEAARRIPEAVSAYYKQAQPALYSSRSADIENAGRQVAEIYGRNVFPDLKVTWGTYRSNLGHTDAPGCFRCHDDQHKSQDGRTITQDCSSCHEVIAMEEASPEILKTLGLAERMAGSRRK